MWWGYIVWGVGVSGGTMAEGRSRAVVGQVVVPAVVDKPDLVDHFARLGAERCVKRLAQHVAVQMTEAFATEAS
ncbi:hypothetical protein Stsp02_25240 [Streptomyces sp. NBRC 14336]|nr:hypothetical protein Stsp02_25240 [Streptomyces sp. NBRC 14336]